MESLELVAFRLRQDLTCMLSEDCAILANKMALRLNISHAMFDQAAAAAAAAAVVVVVHLPVSATTLNLHILTRKMCCRRFMSSAHVDVITRVLHAYAHTRSFLTLVSRNSSC